jgi:hypothetical protein
MAILSMERKGIIFYLLKTYVSCLYTLYNIFPFLGVEWNQFMILWINILFSGNINLRKVIHLKMNSQNKFSNQQRKAKQTASQNIINHTRKE